MPMSARFKSALYVSLISLFCNTAQATPKNVILIIGDGMDDQQITIARNYLHGPTGRLSLDKLPTRSSVQVLTVAEEDPEIPLYVAESAGSGTSMATGHVTSRARISTSAKTDLPLPTILELAQQAGMRTGVVTTSSITDATPAVFMTHINVRMCENPEEMVNERYNCEQYKISAGGRGSIAEQIATGHVDIVLGGGLEHFEKLAEEGAGTIHELATNNGFDVIKSTDELAATDSPRVLGLFAPEHLEVKWRGTEGRTAEQPAPSILNYIHWALGDVSLPEPMNCEPNPDFVGTPSLSQMTEHALESLSGDPGFVLVIESASIDKRAHARDTCGSIGELEQLDQALDAALRYAEANGETLIIVTADHSQAAQIVPDTSLFEAFGIPVFTPGSLVRINMPHGGVMAVNYATNEFFAEEHTGAAVPLFSNHTGRDIPTFITQPEIFNIMKAFLNL